LKAVKICSPCPNFSWFGRLLPKVHSKLLQHFKTYHRTFEEDTKYVWSKDCDEAFQTLKKLLTISQC
jgi:hypothetical protein